MQHLLLALHSAVVGALVALPDGVRALAGSKRPAFIGIVIAITANIIISIALNVQKMAHIRLQQEQQRQQRIADGYEDEDEEDEDDEDDVDGPFENNDYDEQEAGPASAGLRGRRLDAVDTIQEESESPLPSARTSQHLTPLHGSSSVAGDEPESAYRADSGPPSPSPAPRAKPANGTSHSSQQGQSGSSTEVDSSDTPPSQSVSKLIDLEQQENGLHAAGDDEEDGQDQPLLSSRRSSSQHQPQQSSGPSAQFLRSRLWWCGIALMTLGEAGNFISYGFAPASLVAPLGAVALLSNVIIAPILLHERFRPRDLGGIFLAIIGAVTVVYSSRQDDPQLGPGALWDAIKRSIFLIYMAVVLSLGAALAALSLTRLGDRFVLLDVGTCAIFGGFTVLSTKGISSMLSAGPSPFALFRYPITYALAFVLASTAVLQITFLNRALQRFDSRQVIPTMFTLFTIMAIVGSAVLYRDFEDMDAHRLINFLFGCGTTFAGVFLLTRRHEDEDGHDQQQQRERQESGDGRQRREILEDVVEEEEDTLVGGGTADSSTAGGLPAQQKHLGNVVAEPDALSVRSSAVASSNQPTLSSDPSLLVPLRRPAPEHSQSSPVPISSVHATASEVPLVGIPIVAAAGNAAGRRGRTTTALDGTGTAFLAAGSPPGMVFALGNANAADAQHAHAGGSPLVVGSAVSARAAGGLSAVTVPVTPARAGAGVVAVPGSSASATGGGLLPLYRTPRMSLIGSSGAAIPGGVVVAPTPSASISALSAGQLLLLATPTPSAIPIAMGPSSSSHGQHGQGMARSLPGPHGAEGRSRALSQPSTPVPRRRSRRALRADAAAQQQQQQTQQQASAGGRSGSAGTERAGVRENYAKGQGSWTERRRPNSGLGLPGIGGYGTVGGSGTGAEVGMTGPGALGVSGSTSTAALPQRRSVISLFGGWSGSTGSAAPPTAAGPSEVSSPPIGAPAEAGPSGAIQPVARPAPMSRAESDAPGPTEPPILLRNNSAKTSPPALSSPPTGTGSRQTPISPPRISSATWSSMAAQPVTEGTGAGASDRQRPAPLSPPIPRRTISLSQAQEAEGSPADSTAATTALPPKDQEQQ
ncbi:hypothetical protein OC835_006811 [Tilletia horrida]|nr:hypothetical protein OC835_006811 [Tilletia horrida]